MESQIEAGNMNEYNKTMSNWSKYQRTGEIEARNYIEGEDLEGISVSDEDWPPSEGDMVARNPENKDDKWLVSEEYFEQHYNKP
jgi:hypothetical protein